ncbi:MAG: hypothetical protein M1828_001040 [Chrysothrix sp. TS-e1954]|nr:MAG: hypothetical protein M1828_001040 [Chrysothrix sp. TS-e1954]
MDKRTQSEQRYNPDQCRELEEAFVKRYTRLVALNVAYIVTRDGWRLVESLEESKNRSDCDTVMEGAAASPRLRSTQSEPKLENWRAPDRRSDWTSASDGKPGVGDNDVQDETRAEQDIVDSRKTAL